MELRTPESEGQHFMGFLVFFPETTAQLDQRLHVIDGQQRLTTLSLLLIAIRDASEEKGFNDLAREVTERYLIDPLREGAEQFRILLKLRDRREYEAAANREQAPDGRITAALSYFERRLAELTELSEAAGLRHFLALVTRRLEFMCATLEKDNAYNIFKRIHSRWLHTPGNLTLSAYNQSLANRTFGEKRQHYARSNIGMTRELASLENREDQESAYLPTQILAETFRAEGFDGLAYRSGLERGTNVVLFDHRIAKLTHRFVSALQKVRYDFAALPNFAIHRVKDSGRQVIDEIHAESP